jgi:hypothetical protein
MAKDINTAVRTTKFNGGKSMGEKPEQTTSKISMVRQALVALGKHAKPLAIQSYIEAQFQVRVPTPILTAYRALLLKSSKAQTAKPTPEVAIDTPDLRFTAEDTQALRALITRFGHRRVRNAVDRIAREVDG